MTRASGPVWPTHRRKRARQARHRQILRDLGLLSRQHDPYDIIARKAGRW